MDEFRDFLYRHFPHRWLHQKAAGTEKLFKGLGKSIEYAWNYVKLLKRNHSLRTAEELIADLENEYGISINPSLDIEVRRQRLLSRMRIQDSPVTKEDLLKMLEALGLENWRIQNFYNQYTMLVTFKLAGELPGQFQYAKQMLEENVRAHICFRLNGIIYEAVKNKEWLKINSFLLSAHICNLGLEVVCLNGQRRLDGSWHLQSITKAPHLQRLKIAVHANSLGVRIVCLDGQRSLDGAWFLHTVSGNPHLRQLYMQMRDTNSIQLSAGLTRKTLWRLNGRMALDGTKILSEDVEKEFI